MKLIPTALPDVVLIEPTVFPDARGFFMESYNERKFAELGITSRFVQDNHARSTKGTLRGLHFQWQHPQAKLCRVVMGAVFDVVVDIRPDSPTFGQWAGAILSAGNQRQIFVPHGLAHGYLVLSESADFLYKCDDFYAPHDQGAVIWNDPQINIEWPLEEYGISALLLSDKDKLAPRLSELSAELLARF
jgi:dTDP-4-dehydrorhamnose 3,5-epimerase